MLLETVTKYKVDSENLAKDLIEKFREEAADKGYSIKKAGFEYKCKKAKGEIVNECWVVSITQEWGDLWED